MCHGCDAMLCFEVKAVVHNAKYEAEAPGIVSFPGVGGLVPKRGLLSLNLHTRLQNVG